MPNRTRLFDCLFLSTGTPALMGDSVQPFPQPPGGRESAQELLGWQVQT